MNVGMICRPIRRSRKREAVLDAAQAAFLELGYAGTSMDLVAGRAKVSKATIYAHFKGKDDLFGEVIRRRCERDLAFQAPAEGDARSVLASIARRLMGLMLSPETLGIYRVVVAESARHPDLAQAFFAAAPAQGKARLCEVMAELDRRGELMVADPWQAADQFAGMLRAEVFHRALLGLAPPDGRSVDSTIAAAVETIHRAYAPH